MSDDDLTVLLTELHTEIQRLIKRVEHAITLCRGDVPYPPILQVAEHFPDHLRRLLDFTEWPESIHVTPKQWLNTEFGAVADIVRTLGGRYVSKGRDSHFVVPKETR